MRNMVPCLHTPPAHLSRFAGFCRVRTQVPRWIAGRKEGRATLLIDAIVQQFAQVGALDALYAKLDEICKAHNGLWNAEAEKYLLEAKK